MNHAATEERENTEKLANVIVRHTMDNIDRKIKHKKEIEMNDYDRNVRLKAIIKLQGVVRRYKARKELKSLQAQQRIMNALQILMAELGRSDVKSMAMNQADTSVMEKLSRTAARTPFDIGSSGSNKAKLTRSVSDASALRTSGTSGLDLGLGLGLHSSPALESHSYIRPPSNPVTPIDLSSPITKTFHTADSYYAASASTKKTRSAVQAESDDKSASENISNEKHRDDKASYVGRSPNSEITASNTRSNSKIAYHGVSHLEDDSESKSTLQHMHAPDTPTIGSPIKSPIEPHPPSGNEPNSARRHVRTLVYDEQK